MTSEGLLGMFPSAAPLRFLLAVVAIDFLKGGAILLLAWLVSRLWLRGEPAREHSVWALCLCSLLLYPPMWLWVPHVALPAGAWATARGGLFGLAEPLLHQDGFLGLDAGAAGFLEMATRRASGDAAAVGRLLPWVWLAGTAVFLARFALGLLRASLMAVADAAPDILRLGLELQARLGIGRRVTIGTRPDCGMPFTHGILKPRIVLPEEAADWDAERLRAVLIHELAHVRRRDPLSNLAAAIATAALWCVPFAWIAASFMRRAQEKSADLVVLSEGVRASAYASELLELSRTTSGRLVDPVSQSAFGRKNMLKERIKSILDLGAASAARAGGKRARPALAIFGLFVAMTAFTFAADWNGVLVGTWAPDQGSKNPYTYSYTADGKAFAYDSATSGVPSMEARYSTESAWKDADGVSWLRIAVNWSVGKYDEASAKYNKWYVLVKIDASGDRMESQASQSGFPTALDSANYWYGTHRRT